MAVRFYATSLVPNVEDSSVQERIEAIKALREVRNLGDALSKPPSLRAAKDDVDSGAEFLVTETDDQETAKRISAVLEAAAGLEWRVETGPATEPKLSLVPDEEPPANPSEHVIPSYEAGQTACILLAVVNGDIGAALSAAQSLGRVVADDPAVGNEFWNEVTVVLLDSFPVKGPGVREGVEAMATRLHAGGFE